VKKTYSIKDISYSIKKNSRSKHIRIIVRQSGEVCVTAPRWVPQFVIAQHVSQKAEWISDTVMRIKKHTKDSGGVPTRTYTRKDYLEHKEKVEALVQDRIAFYNTHYGFSIGNISIKNQKSRWGSCSANGNITINYKIIFLSPEQQDYVIVHELCHRGEFNHSPRFWALVERTIPEYKHIRKELRGEEVKYV
jgi:predicted metal-dependent hydrolase